VSELSRDASSGPRVFLSYARPDIAIVSELSKQLERHGISAWLDVEGLMPGEQWMREIERQLLGADALVYFVSPASARSEWMERELSAFVSASHKPVFPVLIGGSDAGALPFLLTAVQALDLRDPMEAPRVAAVIAEALRTRGRPAAAPLPPEAEHHAAQLSRDLAENLRASGRPDPSVAPPNSVFLVHGHDHSFREEVEVYLRSLGIEPVVLSKVGGASRSLFQKFETLAQAAQFAVVLLSADDLGASRRQYEGGEDLGGQKTLKYRARENVILELGFFYGKLGWERVFVVHRPAEQVWPDFERPSDLAGVVFFEFSGDSDWREELRTTLTEAGLVAGDGH
jgi:predicted nucleotide-binding protein